VTDDMASLVDRQAVVDVCVRYATALDRRDWALLRTCFTPEAQGDYGTGRLVQGYEAIEQMCHSALEPLAVSQHLLGNFTVEVAGDEASASCYLQAQHVRPGTMGGDNYIVAGTYTDRLVRTPDGWRIARRRLEVTWTDGNPDVLHIEHIGTPAPQREQSNHREELLTPTDASVRIEDRWTAEGEGHAGVRR
jgi:3-phenylpropionate/cinnamic acid dioxygenase small subunit